MEQAEAEMMKGYERSKALFPMHPNFAACLINFGLLYEAKGQREETKSKLKAAALQLFEKYGNQTVV